MWFGQTGLNVNRFETGLSASVNGAYVFEEKRALLSKGAINTLGMQLNMIIVRGCT